MKIRDIIVEGKDGERPENFTQDRGEWRFSDGGIDRAYQLNRIMMAAAMADGRSTKAVDMPQSSWVEKYNTAHPYTEQEHNIMKQAFNSVYGFYEHTGKDHKSHEPDDTNKVSPMRNPGPIKRRN